MSHFTTVETQSRTLVILKKVLEEMGSRSTTTTRRIPRLPG